MGDWKIEQTDPASRDPQRFVSFSSFNFLLSNVYAIYNILSDPLCMYTFTDMTYEDIACIDSVTWIIFPT